LSQILKIIIMKKVTSIALIALLAVGFTSCKKDWTCTCKDKDGKESPYTYPKVPKKTAKASCDAANTSWTAGGGSCSLK
jgi:hypothetical protein